MTSLARERSRALPTHAITARDAHELSFFLIGSLEDDGAGDAAWAPHRHQFTEFVYLTEGSGTHYIDFEALPIHTPQVFMIRPGQVHYWEAETPLRGTLVLFMEDFLAGHFAPSSGWSTGAAGSQLSESSPVMCPGTDDVLLIERILADLEREYRSPDPYQEFVLRNLLTVLLVQCQRMSPSDEWVRPYGLCRDFLTLVSREASAGMTVAGCAERLGVTSGHLYELVVAQTGNSPGEIIRQTTMREAQRLLARTALSCTQVALALGFDDTSYFSRFFRRESGKTPTDFRNTTNRNTLIHHNTQPRKRH